jgi:hypothetical protein
MYSGYQPQTAPFFDERNSLTASELAVILLDQAIDATDHAIMATLEFADRIATRAQALSKRLVLPAQTLALVTLVLAFGVADLIVRAKYRI